MFPTIIGILSTSDGYVTFDKIVEKLKSRFSELATKSTNLESDISESLDRGCKLGLISSSSGSFKLAFDPNNLGGGNFPSELQAVMHELGSIKTSQQRNILSQQSSSATPSAAELQDAPNLPRATRRKFTPILNSLWNKTVDCGPGWSRRPLAQRQAIAIHRRQAAQEKARQRLRAARSQRRSRSRSRSRSRTRARSRSSQRTSRSRSRSRSTRRTRVRSRSGKC
nr:testis-specific H1 histone-like [Aedes albopictus]